MGAASVLSQWLFGGCFALCSEFFHCCIFAGNLTDLSTVERDLCGDGATENSLIDIAKRPRHEASQPIGPGRRMSVADNDAGTKDGEALKTDAAHSVFFMPITRA